MKKGFCIALIISAVISMYSFNTSAFEENDNSAFEETDSSDVESFSKSFLEEYYKEVYLESYDMDLANYVSQQTGLYDYLDIKIKVLQKRAASCGYVSDFSVNVDVKNIQEKEKGYSGTAWITVDFKYPQCDDLSGFGRTAVFEVSENDSEYKIISLFINDDIDSTVLGDGTPYADSIQQEDERYSAEIINKLKEYYCP